MAKKIPLDHPHYADWRVYADWLYDRDGRHTPEWARAIRFAIACRTNPRLILVGTEYQAPIDISRHLVVPGPRTDEGVDIGRITGLRWWTPGYLRRVLESPPWSQQLDRIHDEVCAKSSRDLAGLSDRIEAILAALVGVPRDFAALPETYLLPLTWAWYWKVARNTKVLLRESEWPQAFLGKTEVPI